MTTHISDIDEMKKATVTASDAMGILGIDRKTLYRWRNSGKIRFIEYPVRHYRFYIADIKKIAKEGV